MYMLDKNKLLLLLVVVAVVFWSGSRPLAAVDSAPQTFPFQPGERLVYKLSWGVVPAGSAELAVLPFAELDGESGWHFIMSVRTSEFVDLFYKVRDRIESFTDSALANSKLYNKEQREGKTERDVLVRFDRSLRSAFYSNKGEEQTAIEIKEETIDPLAAIFYIRKQPLAENLEILKSVTDGKKVVEGVAKVVRREKVVVDEVTYDTFLVEPDMQDVSGVFEKSRRSKLKLWITADERRLLVKVKSRVVVGSFTATLVEASGTR